MRVSERYVRGKFRAGAQILPEANVKGTFTLYLSLYFNQAPATRLAGSLCDRILSTDLLKPVGVVRFYILLYNRRRRVFHAPRSVRIYSPRAVISVRPPAEPFSRSFQAAPACSCSSASVCPAPRSRPSPRPSGRSRTGRSCRGYDPGS